MSSEANKKLAENIVKEMEKDATCRDGFMHPQFYDLDKKEQDDMRNYITKLIEKQLDIDMNRV